MSKKPTSQNPKGYHSNLTVEASMKDAPQDNLDFKLRNSPSTSQRFTKRPLGKLGDIFVKGRRNQQSEAKQELAAENAKKVRAAKDAAEVKSAKLKEEKELKRQKLLEEKAEYKAEIAAKKALLKEEEAKRIAVIKEKKVKNSARKSGSNINMDWDDTEFQSHNNSGISQTPSSPRKFDFAAKLEEESSSDKESSEIERQALEARRRKFEAHKDKAPYEESSTETDRQFIDAVKKVKRPNAANNLARPTKYNLAERQISLDPIPEEEVNDAYRAAKHVFFDEMFGDFAERFGVVAKDNFDKCRPYFETALEKIELQQNNFPKLSLENVLSSMWSGFDLTSPKESKKATHGNSEEKIKFSSDEAIALARVGLAKQDRPCNLGNDNEQVSLEQRKIILEEVTKICGILSGILSEILKRPSGHLSDIKQGAQVSPKGQQEYNGPSYV